MSDIELYGGFSFKYIVTEESLLTELSRNVLDTPASCAAVSGPVLGRYKCNAYYFSPSETTFTIIIKFVYVTDKSFTKFRFFPLHKVFCIISIIFSTFV